MALKPITPTAHARFEMRRRAIRRDEVERVIHNPEQIIPSKKGRQIYQSRIGPAGRFLLRVVVKEAANAYRVVTAYKTSKVRKYWKS